jgi:hypothetical protein
VTPLEPFLQEPISLVLAQVREASVEADAKERTGQRRELECLPEARLR